MADRPDPPTMDALIARPGRPYLAEALAGTGPVRGGHHDRIFCLAYQAPDLFPGCDPHQVCEVDDRIAPDTAALRRLAINARRVAATIRVPEIDVSERMLPEMIRALSRDGIAGDVAPWRRAVPIGTTIRLEGTASCSSASTRRRPGPRWTTSWRRDIAFPWRSPA